MKVIQVVKGLKLNDPSFEKLERTPEGIAIGGLPGWEMLLDPDYAETGWIRNRAKPNAKFNLIEAENINTTEINLIQVNGANLLHSHPVSKGGAGQYRAVSSDAKVSIDSKKWTVFCVIKPSAVSDALGYPTSIIRPETNGIPNSLYIGLNPTNGQLRIYNQSVADTSTASMAPYVAAQFPTNVAVDALKVLVITFSEEKGFNAYENGVHLGNVAAPAVTLDASGVFSVYRSSNAAWGLVGALNEDLSLPVNKVYMQKLTSFLMEKYGI